MERKKTRWSDNDFVFPIFSAKALWPPAFVGFAGFFGTGGSASTSSSLDSESCPPPSCASAVPMKELEIKMIKKSEPSDPEPLRRQIYIIIYYL